MGRECHFDPQRFPCDHSVSQVLTSKVVTAQEVSKGGIGWKGWMESSQLQGIFFILNSWEDESFESWDDEFTVVIIGETLGF